MERSQVLVVGGAGYFGRLLVQELLAGTDCVIRLGGRSRERLAKPCAAGPPGRLAPAVVDLHDRTSVQAALEGVRLAICAAGPFQNLPVSLAELCLECGIHYVDLADARGYVTEVVRLAARRGEGPLPTVCTGWSAAPALSGLLARLAADEMEQVESIQAQIAPGNRNPRAPGTVASLLYSAGQPMTIWREGRRQTITGWSAPDRFHFPPPIGPRTGYLVDVPDYEVLPPLFGARRVEFRAGSELAFQNWLLSGLVWLTGRGMVRSWVGWTPVLRAGMALFGWLGHDWGAIGVRVTGRRGGKSVAVTASIVADRQGERIAILPAAVMAQRLLSGALAPGGLVPWDGWLTRAELETACARRGMRLVMSEESAQ